jgi:hypothetical protein
VFLRQSADQERTSVNFLVNRALRKLVEWDSPGEKFGIVSIPYAFIDKAMSYMNEEQAAELGRWVGTHLVKEFITFWFKEVSARTLLQGYPRLTAQYGRAFDYEEHSEGPRWVIVLKHGGGARWSTYYGELLRAILKEHVHREVDIERGENQVVARFTLA